LGVTFANSAIRGYSECVENQRAAAEFQNVEVPVQSPATLPITDFNKEQSDLRIAARSHPDFPDAAVLNLEGSLDTENATAFHHTVVDVMTRLESVYVLVFDMERLKYISSSGIGAFTNILVAAHQYGFRILLYGLSFNVRSVFDTLGFSQFFSLVDRWEEIGHYVRHRA
jgi:anti-sigma B factor antagonist